MDLAKYHELGRFSAKEDDYDKDAAFFHLKQSAMCGNVEAVDVMAKIYLQLPHDVLTVVSVNVSFQLGVWLIIFIYTTDV